MELKDSLRQLREQHHWKQTEQEDGEGPAPSEDA